MMERTSLVCFVLFMNCAYSSIWPAYKSFSKMGCYRKAAVATDSVPCAPVGVDILKRNGSAVDAAIAMLICIGANNPQSSGLGGGFLMLYYNRTQKKSHFIDSREVVPRKAKRRTSNTGPDSIAVPGELAGYAKAHSLFGRLPWKKLFTQTIKMCQKGILVSKHLENAIAVKNLPKDEEIGKTFLKNGSTGYKKGERIKLTKLAKTLKVISKIGKKALYGPSKMAKQFLADLKAAGSPIDRIDMKQYRPRIRKPVRTNLRKKIRLHSVSSPGSGVSLSMMLAILDDYGDLSKNATKKDRLAAKFIHRFIEAIKYAEKHKPLMGDTDSKEMEKFISKFSSRTYLDAVRRKISHLASYDGGFSYKLKRECDSSTAHISVLAPDGDAVSVTSSINRYFGSFIMSPSTGIILNNHMADFTSDTVIIRNRTRVSKRPRSSMCPSIFTDRNDNVNLVIGSAGGHRIPSTVMQIAARFLYFDENIKESIDAPRLHASEDGVEFESNFPKEMKKVLKKFGHTSQKNFGGLTIATGISRNKSGDICANYDYRKDGGVDGLN